MTTTAVPAPPPEVPTSQPSDPGVVPVVPSIEPVAPETVPQVPPAPLAQPDVAPLAPPAPESALPIVEDSPLPVPTPVTQSEPLAQPTTDVPLRNPVTTEAIPPTPAVAIPEVTTAEIQPQTPIGEMPPAPEAPVVETPVESPQSLEAGIASETQALQQPQPPAPETQSQKFDPESLQGPALEAVHQMQQALVATITTVINAKDFTMGNLELRGTHLVLPMTLLGTELDESAESILQKLPPDRRAEIEDAVRSQHQALFGAVMSFVKENREVLIQAAAQNQPLPLSPAQPAGQSGGFMGALKRLFGRK